MKARAAILWRWIPVVLTIACLCAIYLFSQQNSRDSSITSGTLLRWILALVHGIDQDQVSAAEIKQYSFLIRKLAHFSIYAALGFFSGWTAFGFLKRFPAAIAWLFCTGYAASDEIHQLFISGRSGSWRDVAIDSLGALVGTLCIAGIFACIRHRKRKSSRKATL